MRMGMKWEWEWECGGVVPQSSMKDRMVRGERSHEVEHDAEKAVERVSQPHRGWGFSREVGQRAVGHCLESDDRAGARAG